MNVSSRGEGVGLGEECDPGQLLLRFAASGDEGGDGELAAKGDERHMPRLVQELVDQSAAGADRDGYASRSLRHWSPPCKSVIVIPFAAAHRQDSSHLDSPRPSA